MWGQMSNISDEKKIVDFYNNLSDIRKSLLGNDSDIAYRVMETEIIPTLEKQLSNLNGGIQKQQFAYSQAETRAKFYFDRAEKVRQEASEEEDLDLRVKMQKSATKSEDLGKKLKLFFYFTYLKEYITLEDEIKEEKKSN